MPPTPSLRSFSSQSGFTLVEIMIVVGIIGVLAAIAIPQYRSYITQAKHQVCIRNVQIAQNIVKEEITKLQNAVNKRQDIVNLLNEGGKKNPITGQGAAFITGGKQEVCQILFENLDGNKIPTTGEVIVHGYIKDPADPSKLIPYQTPIIVE